MNIEQKIASELDVRLNQVEAAVKLLDDGNTVPFISRYRKEATGGLNDEQLRELAKRLEYLRNLEERKEAVIASIEEQGKLTEELKAAINAAETLVKVEDLYRPYKQKRRTRATIAKEKGLEPLANILYLQMSKKTLEEEASAYINPEKDVNTVGDAIAGACDIIAEVISDNADYRTWIREKTINTGIIESKAKTEGTESVYEMYYDYSEGLKKLPGHRVLALNRGEKEGVLKVSIESPVEDIHNYLKKQIIRGNNESFTTALISTIEDAYKRLIEPSIHNEIRSMLTDTAEDGAIKVFGKNLNQLLMQPPIAGRCVLGWDPAFRTGCKLAVVDATGKVIDTTVIYPTAPQNKVEEAKKTLKSLVNKYDISLISVGNGTASRESEAIIVEFIKEMAPKKLEYVIVNEAGASVYSASELATEEFPNFDVGQRSAASIARRLQDPLAELVKIDSKSIGVGQYQHDMNQTKLSDALTGVVESCVNAVGVDLNTASAALLEYVAGINKTIAKNIVSYREENGRFTSRATLKKVPKLGPKAFEQCAGFMRISDAKNPLDSTAVHPESYDAVKLLLEKMGHDIKDIKGSNLKEISKEVKDVKKMAEEIGVGAMTLTDILKELEKPGRDPREDMPAPILKTDVMELEDLREGMILKGTIRNVIDFGAFVDIGVHQDGLVHISQLCDRYIKHPLEAVSVGDIVEVKVLSVDVKKKRIALTMKGFK